MKGLRAFEIGPARGMVADDFAATGRIIAGFCVTCFCLTLGHRGYICKGAHMCRRILWLTLLFAGLPAPALAKVENWIQVTSPHFVVVTNAGEKQGRRVADQFERMRSVFHALFPKAQVDPGSPIIVLAIKDEKDFRALEPDAYLAKGSLKLGGLFLRAADKNYVLMRLDAQEEHPYSVVYHEYTHLILSKIEDMPLWLNEGLAEFYQNTDIYEKEVDLGQTQRRRHFMAAAEPAVAAARPVRGGSSVALLP